MNTARLTSTTGRRTTHNAAARERAPFPGELVLHPVAVAALCVLVLNDHVFKTHWPGVLTGKLSDVAGLVVCPVFLVACLELFTGAFASRRAIATICIATAIAFSLTKTWSPATDAYRVVWAALRWPFAVVASVARHERIGGLGRVAAVRDPTDLVALPAVIVAWFVCRASGTRGASSCPR